jgi:membrane protease YdiL (CAAX protease family)
VIGARAAGPDRLVTLVVAVGVATATRALIGGPAPAGSIPAAIAFAAVLAAVAVAGGARPRQVSWPAVAVGAGGGAALVLLSLVGVAIVVVGPRAAASTLTWWVPLVAVVAGLEELVFRGLLFEAVRARSTDTVAIAVTAGLFALIHLPLYGPAAMPIDLCVGVFLGCLRTATGGVTAPLVAHVVADVATGWLG